jgi:hypothetical protein
MKDYLRQRLSYNEKIKDDYRWAKNVIDSVILTSKAQPDQKSSEYNRMLSNYMFYNNIINQKDFEAECNPLGLDVAAADEVKAYNKTPNKINVLLTAESRRPFEHKALLVNGDGIKSKLAFKDSLIKQFVMSEIQNAITNVNESFDKELVDSMNPIIDPADVSRYMSTKYLHRKEILANKLLEHYRRLLDISTTMNETFKHALLSAYEIAYVYEDNGIPKIKPVNPLGFFHIKSSDTKYVEDGIVAGEKFYMPIAAVIDEYYEDLTEDQIASLEVKNIFQGSGPKRYMEYDHVDFSSYYNTPVDGQYFQQNTTDSILIQRIEWKSLKKIGFLTFIDENGDETVEMVSEDFKTPKEATVSVVDMGYNKKFKNYVWEQEGISFSLRWTWVEEVWEGTKIGEKVYVRLGPKKHQFRSIDDPYSTRLGYHGIVYSATNAPAISLMDRMRPFAHMYMAIMHKMKKMIAQDKGPIFPFDTSMVDPKIGLEKTLYYLTEMNLDFYSSLQNAQEPGAGQRSGKVGGRIDMSTASNIMNYIGLLEAIDQQISDIAGIPKEREGQIMPNQAVTNTQNSIAMSSMITEVYLAPHDRLWERILDSFLKIAVDALKGKKTSMQMVLDDMSIQTLELAEDDFVFSDFGIFVSSSTRDSLAFEELRGLTQALIQNDKAKFSDIIRMLKTTSLTELQEQIIDSEKRAEEAAASSQQAQMQAQAEMQKQQQDFELEKLDKELEGKILIAQIDSFKFKEDQDIDKDGFPDQLEVERFREEIRLKDRELDIKEKDVKNKAIKTKK